MNCGFGPVPDAYKVHRRISVTKALRLLKCPAKFKYEIDHPAERTRVMRQGSMVDAFILSPNEFFKTYEVLDKSKYLVDTESYKARLKEHGLPVTGTKEVLKHRLLDNNKAFRMEFLDEYQKEVKKEFITQDDMIELIAIKESLYKNKAIIQDFGPVDQGMNQVLGWKYVPEYDLVLTFKLDRIYNGKIIDIKKTPSCEYYKFQRKVQEEGLFIQAASYMWLMKDMSETKDFMFYAYEHEGPYIWSAFKMIPQFLDEGLSELFRALRMFNECMDNDYWPAYDNRIMDLHPSAWFIDSLERKRENELGEQ